MGVGTADERGLVLLHLAVDIGGTFTDICVFDEDDGTTRVGKVSSTRDPIDAVFEGIGGGVLARRRGPLLPRHDGGARSDPALDGPLDERREERLSGQGRARRISSGVLARVNHSPGV